MKKDKDISYPVIPDSDDNKNYPIEIDETEELKAEIVVLKSENSFLRKENASLKEEIISLKEKIKQLKEGNLIKKLPNGNIEFGYYPQGGNGEIKPIEWQILDRKDNRMLVISRYALDCQQYNRTLADITWEKCTLRTWLNSTFINNAFNNDEKELIPSVTVFEDEKWGSSIFLGNSTTDKVFLLSINEANGYFTSDTDRQCKSTEYTKAQGAYTDDNGNCWWWLRSPDYYSSVAAGVYSDGDVNTFGSSVVHSSYAVRPALWINLES